MFSMMKNNKME